MAMRLSFEERLAEYGLTAPQWAVLARLSERDASPQVDIGRSLGVDKATISGIVRRLETKKLVKSRRDPADRRLCRVCLTEDGRKLGRVLPRCAERTNRAALSGFTSEQTASLKASLRRLLENCTSRSQRMRR